MQALQPRGQSADRLSLGASSFDDDDDVDEEAGKPEAGRPLASTIILSLTTEDVAMLQAAKSAEEEAAQKSLIKGITAVSGDYQESSNIVLLDGQAQPH